jgi:hypothetical protein
MKMGHRVFIRKSANFLIAFFLISFPLALFFRTGIWCDDCGFLINVWKFILNYIMSFNILVLGPALILFFIPFVFIYHFRQKKDAKLVTFYILSLIFVLVSIFFSFF